MEKSKFLESRRHGTPNFPMEFFELGNKKGQLYINLHWHRNIEVLLIHDGTFTITINHNDYFAVPGDIFIINQEELHRIYSNDVNLSYGVFIFPLSSLEFAVNDSSVKSFSPIADGKCLFPEYIPAGDSLGTILRSLLDSILEAQLEQFSGWQLFIKAQLIRFTAELMRNKRLVKPEGLNAEMLQQKNERLKQILTFINDNCASNLSLDVLAKEFHVTKKYFSRYFIRESGQGFTEFLNRCRVEKACQLLKDTDMSVLDISLEVGYDNISYFIRVFRNKKGCTPLKYRKRPEKKIFP